MNKRSPSNEPLVLKAHSQPVYALCAIHNGKEWFSAGGDRVVLHWTSPSEVKAIAQTTATVYSLCYDQKHQSLWVGQADGSLLWLDLAHGRINKRIEAGNDPIFHLSLAPDQKHLAVLGHSGRLDYYELQTGILSKSWPLPANKCRQMCWDSTSKRWNICADEGTLWIFDPENPNHEIQKLTLAEWPLFSCLSLENGQRIFGGKDARLYFLNAKNRLIFPGLEAHNYAIYQIKLNPNGTCFATASRDKTAKWWQADSGKLLGRLGRPKHKHGHTHSVNDLCWLNNQTLLTAGDDQSLRIWELPII